MSDAPSVPLAVEAAAVLPRARWQKRGLAAAGLLGGAIIAISVMSARPSLPGGFFIGLLGTLVASLSGLWFAQTFARPVVAERSVALATVRWPALGVLGAVAFLWILLRLAVAGVLPAQEPLLAVLVPAGFLGLAAASATLLGTLGFLSDPELPLWRRHGFWLVSLTTLLYLPMLGNFGLIDPWETHYGEVAREMLSRDDWISLWWAQEGWFWSKPILNFWAQGLSFAAFGVKWAPDQMIAAIAQGRGPAPEWAVRLPIVAFALVGQQLAYIGARAYLGRLPAFLGAFVLATTPYWYLLAHQSMADMPYVGPMCAAMGLILLALRAGPEQRVASVRISLSRDGVRALTLSGYHLVYGSLLLLVVPQVFYLISRNVTLEWAELPWRVLLHLDTVISGSTGNCGLPGNTACTTDYEGSHALLQPAGAALLWGAAALALLWLGRDERRLKRLCYLGAWLFVALSFMAKGAPGLVLVLFTLGAFIVVRARWSELRHLELLGFGLVMASVAAPWFVQEYLRHGGQFFERLFIHDMYLRAFDHVHDTNKGDDTSFRYYVWQLGYGLFPWSGLAAVGTLSCIGQTLWAPRGDGPRRAALEDLGDVTYFCVLWQLAAFGMFSITGTKFHHYILPLVPPAAVLTGVLLASLFTDSRVPQPTNGAGSEGRNPSTAAWAFAAALIVFVCGRDLAVTRPSDVQGAARFVHLFSYNYSRSWPGQLDYSVILWVFASASAVACLLLAWPRLQRLAAIGLCACSVVVSAWCLDVYLVQISPHWGQRETISTYYARRAGPEEPLIAYQLNWKGENFYTGNNVPAFVSSGKRFTEWVESEKKKGTKVMFFTTEHSRLGTLKRELTNPAQFEQLTDETLNDKFALVRVVL